MFIKQLCTYLVCSYRKSNGKSSQPMRFWVTNPPVPQTSSSLQQAKSFKMLYKEVIWGHSLPLPKWLNPKNFFLLDKLHLNNRNIRLQHNLFRCCLLLPLSWLILLLLFQLSLPLLLSILFPVQLVEVDCSIRHIQSYLIQSWFQIGWISIKNFKIIVKMVVLAE